MREEIWRELAITYEADGRAREARIASLPLLQMGVNDEKDDARISVGRTMARAGFDRSRFVALFSNNWDRRAQRTLRPVPFSPPSAPPSPSSTPQISKATGSRRETGLPTEANHPLREIANHLAAALDIRSFDLFLHRVRNRGITIEFGAHPAMLVPATIMEKDPQTQTFMLAQPMTQIARGYHAIDKLTPRELDVLLASAARIVKPDFGSGLTSEEFLNEQTRRLQRAIPQARPQVGARCGPGVFASQASEVRPLGPCCTTDGHPRRLTALR